MNENVKPCKICGKPIDEDDWDICEDCIEKNKTFENATLIGHLYKDEVLINEFLLHCFSADEIERILFEKFMSLSSEEREKHIRSYIEDDMLFFVDWLVRINGKR